MGLQARGRVVGSNESATMGCFRHLVVLILLAVAVLGVIHGLHAHGFPIDARQAAFVVVCGVLGFLTVLVAYIVLVAVLGSVGIGLRKRSPVWADRIIRMGGLLSKGNSHVTNLFFLHQDNFPKMDELWAQVEPGLRDERPSVAMALATNYAPSLSARGKYARAREIMKQNEATHPSRFYAVFQAHYWVNLGWYEHELGDFEQVDYCIRRAQQESLTEPSVAESFASLRAMLTYEQSDHEQVRRLVEEWPRQYATMAWLLCEIGVPSAAASKLPTDLNALHRFQRTYYYLAQASITNNPELLKKVDRVTGLVAYHAIKHFNDSSYLEQALQNDPESIWTKRAQAAGS